MRAEKKLERCDESCKYSSSGVCAFGLRDRAGCFLDPGVRKLAANIIIEAKAVNSIEMAKTVLRVVGER